MLAAFEARKIAEIHSATEETILQMIENGEFVHSAGQRFKEYKGETQPLG